MRGMVIGGIMAVLALSACTSATTVSTQPAAGNLLGTSSGAAHTAPAAAKAAPTKTAPKVAHVGDPIIIKGDDGEQIAVTLAAVDAHPHATDNFSTPNAGQQYYAAEFRIVNNSPKAIRGAVDNDAQVMDAAGQRFQTDIVDSISSGPMFPTPLTVAQGGTALGWVVFQVPTGTVVTGAQFTLDAGFGNSAQWVIP